MLDGFLGAIIGAGVTIVIGLFTMRLGYKQLFAQTVSSSRMQWITVWRESVSALIASAHVLRKHEKHCCDNGSQIQENDDKYLFQFEQAKENIIIRLNMNEDHHCQMYAMLKEFDYSNNNNDTDFERDCIMIEELGRRILKTEWERVKLEARGRRV